MCNHCSAVQYSHLLLQSYFVWQVKLESNTVESPIPDGGGMVHSITGDRKCCVCAFVYRLGSVHIILTTQAL
jgi:hypothetical protein